jgi:hypothetical protein
MRDKLGQELPKTVEETQRILAELKIERGLLVQRGAPVHEVDVLRRRARSLESWLQHLNRQAATNGH